MDNGIEIKEEHPAELSDAVSVIKTAILQSQARAAKGVNQEQLALYYGIGRFISVNTRKRNWGAGIIDGISERLKAELPGLRGFGTSNLKNMRAFYEAWNMLEPNSPIQIGELSKGAEVGGMMAKTGGLEADYGSSAIQIAENIPQLVEELVSVPWGQHRQRKSAPQKERSMDASTLSTDAGPIAAVAGNFLCGLVGKIVAQLEENSKRLLGDEFDRAGVGCGLCDII